MNIVIKIFFLTSHRKKFFVIQVLQFTCEKEQKFFPVCVLRGHLILLSGGYALSCQQACAGSTVGQQYLRLIKTVLIFKISWLSSGCLNLLPFLVRLYSRTHVAHLIAQSVGVPLSSPPPYK